VLPLNQARFNPVHYGMELLSHSQNQSMLRISTNGFRLHGFASANDTTGATQLFLINKYDGLPQRVRVSLPQQQLFSSSFPNGAAAVTYTAPTEIVSVVDDAPVSVPAAERWGRLTAAQPLSCVVGVCEFVLPPLSFSRLS
jgi:hypothetical protein